MTCPQGCGRYVAGATCFECRQFVFVVLTAMRPSPPPLTHKLILGTLLLILACLVVLLARSFRVGAEGESDDGAQAGLPGGFASSKGARQNESGRPIAPWLTNTSRSVPTNRLTFQPARTGSASAADAPAVESPPVTAVIPPLPVLIADARTAVIVDDEAGGAGGTVSVTGRVTLRGSPPHETPIDLGPQCGPLNRHPVTTRHYVVNSAGDLANVLVFLHKSQIKSSDSFIQDMDQVISEMVEGKASTLTGSILLDQKGCMFEPYVSAMQLSQTLRVRNSDAVFHNVHLTPRLNRESNIGQPLKQVNTIRIATPESFIRVKCDVHPWMFAFVSVLPHPYFAVTSTNGTYRIPAGLPSGDYLVTAAHLKLGRKSTGVTIRNGSSSHVDFEFNVAEPATRQATVARPRL